jgi:hypothetical protein
MALANIRVWGAIVDRASGQRIAFPKITYWDLAGERNFIGDAGGNYEFYTDNAASPVIVSAAGYVSENSNLFGITSGFSLSRGGADVPIYTAPYEPPAVLPGAPVIEEKKDNTILYAGLAIAAIFVAKKMKMF